jgi:hypothetical protein
MGIAIELINMVKVFFQDTKLTICINGGITSFLKVERGVRHGSPLVPYLFILVKEVFNFMMKEVTSKGVIKGIFFRRVQGNK